jgi:GT2 family glycosyltransferase
MTSLEKNGPMRWDYNIQRYKSGDPFSEKGLISVVFLACGRHEVTRRCLLSTVDAVARSTTPIEWIFIENGRCDENLDLFDEIPVDRKVIVRQNNYGINEGLNQGWALSRGEFILIHENDWECRSEIDFLSIACDIFNEKSDIGIVQLRAINDPRENWGFGKPEYSPWSSTDAALANANIKVWKEHTKKGHPYFLSVFPNGFNNNPIMMRKTLYRECGPYPEAEMGTDPRHGETLYQSRVANSGCAIAHIGLELFYHCGQVTTKAN